MSVCIRHNPALFIKSVILERNSKNPENLIKHHMSTLTDLCAHQIQYFLIGIEILEFYIYVKGKLFGPGMLGYKEIFAKWPG